MVLGPKWVAVNSNGLKLWENDATGLRIIFKLLFWHSGPKIYKKNKNLELNQIGYRNQVYPRLADVANMAAKQSPS